MPEYGVRASIMKDHLYLVDGGAIYTTPWISSPATVRRAVAISLTARGAPFDLRVGETAGQYQAVVVKSMVERGIHADNVRLITFLIDPTHPQFRVFRSVPAPGFVSLSRDIYRSLDDALDAAYAGALPAHEVRALYRDAVTATARALPAAGPSDPRIDQVLALLRANSEYSVSQLAAAVGLSFSRMSHLFTESMGMSLRSYQLWLKVHAALTSLSRHQRLTDVAIAAGFSDLAHFSRVILQAFGAPLSYFRDNDNVRVFPCGGGASDDWRRSAREAG